MTFSSARRGAPALIYRLMLCVLILGVIGGHAASGNDQNDQNDRQIALEVLREYFDLINADNFTIAGDMWMPECVERSRRFGITFEDCPIRTDCNSLVLRNLDQLRHKLYPPAQRQRVLEDGWVELEFRKLLGGGEVVQKYYVQRRGDWGWFYHLQDKYAHDWKQVESKYVRVRIHPSVEGYINPLVLDEADRWVEAMCDTLSISDDVKRDIEDQKIEYFFCAGDSVVQQITGHLTKGMLHLPTNDIISAVFPHHHEMTHLLVNCRLQSIPLFTLPLLQEGVAVRYGGRWGKHSAALLQLGVFLYREELVNLDSILTYHGFNEQAGADIVYPVAGLVSAYMLDRIGQDRYFDLYREFSGSESEVSELKTTDIQRRLAEAVGQNDWDAFVADFESYLDNEFGEHLAAVPGRLKKGKERVSGEHYKVVEDKHWLGFEFTPQVVEGNVHGNLLFAPDEDLAQHTSSLFEEQYQAEIPFEGYRYGVRFDRNEVGLYDYLTNRLVAKYIWGIEPSDDYFDERTGTVSVMIRKELVDNHLPEKKSCSFIRY